MEKAMWLASIFGPFLAIMGVWILFYHGNMMKVCTSVRTTPGILYMMGVINLLIGLTVLNQFNMWMWAPALLVTLFGWAMLVRGLLVFFLPQLLVKKTMTKSRTLRIKGVCALIWGLAMCWFAFWM